MVRPARGPVFHVFFMQFLNPLARTVPRQQPTSRAKGRQVGTAGYTPWEGGARWLDPLGCQSFIRKAVLGHQRDITLRYGWIWGLGSWTLCLRPADWIQYTQAAMD